VAGRWFSAPAFSGPWTFATPKLPEDFQKIPLEHPRSRVLASVPGTQQAAEAVLLAQIPQTARVNKKEMKAPEVKYQGEPKFEPVEKTKVERAVNTDKSIIKVGDMYYMCYEGVWFMGSSPNVPWTVASKVPGEIYEIPISSPAHTVTYVTVEDDDDEWATFATAAMYTGVMVAWGCAVWGSGWYYPPYYGGFYGGYPATTVLPYLRLRRLVQPLHRRQVARWPTVCMVVWRQRALQPLDRDPFGGARPTDPTAPAPRARPTTPAPAPTARRARARTSTEAGAAPRSSGATSGLPPTA
jgi:hypothetical protein